MAQYFQIHPDNPQARLIRRSVEIIREGGVIVYPTDSSYAFGCQMDNKSGLDRIRRIRQLEEDHNFTLVCRDLSQISTFAKINNEAFRLIKSLTPGPFTFILKATRETPRRLQHSKRKTIGIRLPDNPITLALVAELNEPLFSSTLILPGDDDAMTDPEDIRDRLEKEVDLIIDAGVVPYTPTTIIGFIEDTPEIVRQGSGIVASLQ
ncbi:MAG: threonylcarbamoyl-AMP synthase [Methylocaldum sp.]|jgi:tRNA threonylcarbamoyl adenosine modification protein (Sua5/YciO/YrdC/YwlC family)|uniref:L-threonylcarbamoyladenylate synthase n=1 Tax=Methylocaldum sp. 14B TaxID=1912213 RepID=UPI00098B1A0E|nr:L-threonylcarbamoyladenylate synthase [Methylocaldum sp. 14B]MDV3241303.1 threonylcarbamoyl-AMP synthase [Methylocaldum sp.]